MNDKVKELIKYRIERAESCLQEAELLASNLFLLAAANRLYYCCFYAINALFIKYNLVASKHSGVRSLFNKEFIKTQIIPVEFGNLFNELFIFRQEADYRDFIIIDAEEFNSYMIRTKNS